MSHYSLAQKPSKLKAWAKKVANLIKDEGIINPVLVYTGMSGIAGATALSLALNDLNIKHGMAYIRKEHEQSHGEAIEVDGTYSLQEKYIFVDDFICSGETLKRCFDNLKDNYDDFKGFNYIALQGSHYLSEPLGLYSSAEEIAEQHPDFVILGRILDLMDFPSEVAPKITEPIPEKKTKIMISGIRCNNLCPEVVYDFNKLEEPLAAAMVVEYTKRTNNIPFWANDWRRK